VTHKPWPYWVVLTAVLLTGCSQPDQPVSQTKLASQGLLSAALSPDGEYLFTGSFQHGGALWDQTHQARLFDWNHSDADYSAYSAADFSEDGKFLAATDGATVTIWNADTGQSALYLQSPAQSLNIRNTEAIWQTSTPEANNYWQRPARITDIAFSRQYVLLALENQLALLVDSARQEIIGALNHSDLVTDVAMDDRANLAVTGTRNGELTLWTLNSGDTLNQRHYQSPISFVAMSRDGRQVVVAAAQGPVELLTFDAAHEPAVTRLFSGNPGIIAAIFDQGNLILGSSRERIWRIEGSSGEIQNQWQIPARGPWHKAAVLALYSRAGTIQAIASDGYAYQLN
jgi:WD40 repeat protein